MPKQFQPTPEMTLAAEGVFLCMAIVETIRPIVEGYKKRILAEGQWPINKKYAGKFGATQTILNPKDSYLLEPEAFASYLKLCNEARIAAKLHVDNEEKCPLLVAENQLLKAEYDLCKVMAAVTNVEADRITAASRENYRKYIELTLQLLGPFVRSSAKLMQDHGYDANGQKV